MSEKVAIFLDVENLSGWLKADGGDILLERANELGRVVVRRAYGDFSIQAVSVRQPELNLLGFELVHTYHPVKGKNSADIQIVVDVMEYLARIPDLEWFVLATGDSDFSPLFRRLRELGKSVVGVGPRSALSEAVKKSCNRFIYIDKEAKSENDVSSSLKKNQLREDALDLLERTLDKFPDGVTISVLKHNMLEIDSAFDEKNLGFNGFLKFLQSASEIVTLYQLKTIWHAKATETSNERNGATTNGTKPKADLVGPTFELYKQLLDKSGWRSCESSFLWDSLTKLQAHFPLGFTKSEEFKYLMEAFGNKRTREDLRTAMYIFNKTGFVTIQPQKKNDESILMVTLPESEKIMSRKIDAVLLNRLAYVCKSHNTFLNPELITPLLINSYTKEQFKVLIESAQS